MVGGRNQATIFIIRTELKEHFLSQMRTEFSPALPFFNTGHVKNSVQLPKSTFQSIPRETILKSNSDNTIQNL